MVFQRYLSSMGRCVLYMTNQVYKNNNYRIGDFQLTRQEITSHKEKYLNNFKKHPNEKIIREQFISYYYQIKENPYKNDKELNYDLDVFIKKLEENF